MAIGDHVDAVDGRNRLDIFQALERLDGHADYDVGIGPWRILGRVTGAIAPVSGVHPLPRDAAIADRGKFGLPRDRARLFRVIDLRDLDAHNPLIEDPRDQIGEGFVDPHDRGNVGGLNHPARFAIVSWSKAPCSWSIIQ